MKRLIAITLLFAAASAFAAAQKLYELPVATTLGDDDRMYIHQGLSSNRNLTGLGLKNVISQVAWPPGTTKVFQAVSSSTIPVQLVSAVRNRRGVITGWTWEDGKQFWGTPGYNHTYIYPFNGMTNVSRSTPLVVGSYWLARGVIAQSVSIQGVPAFSVKALKGAGRINGLQNFAFLDFDKVDQSALDAWYWGINTVGTLAANTTYTIRSDMTARWGGTNGMYSPGMDPCTYTLKNTSSAKVMTNYSAVLCRSTFRTGSI